MKLVNRLESEPKHYGTDSLLTGTEIHLIEIIGDNSDYSVSDTARAFGVTRGAVSQKLKILEKKGMTTKEPDPNDLKRSIVTLTSKGKGAYFVHKHWHEMMDGGFQDYYKNLDTEKSEVILEFLTMLEKLFTNLLSVKV